MNIKDRFIRVVNFATSSVVQVSSHFKLVNLKTECISFVLFAFSRNSPRDVSEYSKISIFISFTNSQSVTFVQAIFLPISKLKIRFRANVHWISVIEINPFPHFLRDVTESWLAWTRIVLIVNVVSVLIILFLLIFLRVLLTIIIFRSNMIDLWSFDFETVTGVIH